MNLLFSRTIIAEEGGDCKRKEAANIEILFFVCHPKMFNVFKRLGREGCSSAKCLILLDIFWMFSSQISASL